VAATVAWIKDFSDTYHAKTGVYPLLYTNPSWWQSCTGNSNAFVTTNPLVLARYAASAGTIPGGWRAYDFWQYNDAYTYGGDSDVWNGDMAGLLRLAHGS
jgi:GH25 family lysozyme M1 (1,4-beta-N-acetylmuramidase)